MISLPIIITPKNINPTTIGWSLNEEAKSLTNLNPSNQKKHKVNSKENKPETKPNL